MRAAERAVIWIDAEARGQPRADFTGAHELGHHLLHGVVDHFAQCHGEDAVPARTSREARDAERRVRLVEREASHFATELLMPEAWAAPLCDLPRPTLDDVHRLARTFRTSLHASAIRFVEQAAAPCAFVHTVGGRIRRSTETSAFPGAIVQRRALHPQSLAAALQHEPAGPETPPREVSGAAWGDPSGPGFVEHAIALGPALGVMSWIVAVK